MGVFFHRNNVVRRHFAFFIWVFFLAVQLSHNMLLSSSVIWKGSAGETTATIDVEVMAEKDLDFRGGGVSHGNMTTREETEDNAMERSKEDAPPQQRVVHFLRSPQIDLRDMFSATWWQPVDLFLTMPMDKIRQVEDACFRAFDGPGRKPRVRMTLDWLDFSVEHLSKWWKVVPINRESRNATHHMIEKLEKYVSKAEAAPETTTTIGQPTIALIAFMPVKGNKDPDTAKRLTVTSLAATIASLLKVGFGRIVVVGNREEDFDLSQEAFGMFRNTTKGEDYSARNETIVSRVGETEVGFVQVVNASSELVKINLPKGALVGLKDALQGNLAVNETKAWLGEARERSFWKYVYLTEPDTILQTRPSTLPQLKDALDNGFILSPHRLQIVPHESDVAGYSIRTSFVPAEGNFSTVREVDALAGDVCCDAGKEKPGAKERCGQMWALCGFGGRHDGGGNATFEERHWRLREYGFMRLRQGTGIATLVGTNHARRCVHRRDAMCEP